MNYFARLNYLGCLFHFCFQSWSPNRRTQLNAALLEACSRGAVDGVRGGPSAAGVFPGG